MNIWMKMTKDQRKEQDELQKSQTMFRKKLLIKKIREEYKEVSKLRNKKGREPFLPLK